MLSSILTNLTVAKPLSPEPAISFVTSQAEYFSH